MEKTAPTPPTPAQDLEAPDTVAKQSSVKQKLTQNLSTTHADLVCLLLCFLTGLCDSSAYNAWSCFLGMQTGMTDRLRKGQTGRSTPQKLTKTQETPFFSVSAPPTNQPANHGAGSSLSSRFSPSFSAR